jgi:Sialic acid synthase
MIFRRSLYAICDIRKGELLTVKNIRSIRPGYGLHPRYLPDIIGARAASDIARGTPINWSMLVLPANGKST